MIRTEEIFNQVRGYLSDRTNYDPVDDATIMVYADAVANWERLTAAIEEEGHQVQDRDDLARKNPKLMAQRQYSETIAKYSQLLGITAYGRKKAQITAKAKEENNSVVANLRPIQRRNTGGG